MTEDTVAITQEIKSAEESGVRIEYYTMDGPNRDIYMCPGDLMCICNVLYDYSRIFEDFIKEAKEKGEAWKEFTYGYHLNRCRKIQKKIEESLGYSTEAAIINCRKKQGRKEKDDDVGEDALTLLVRKNTGKPVKLLKEKEEQEYPGYNKKGKKSTAIEGQMEMHFD